MKICWDNLEKLKYRHDKGAWQAKYLFYIYEDSCKNCGEPFLGRKENKGYCSISCSSKNKHLSEETKKKIGRSVQKGNGVTKNNIPLFDTFAHQISFCEQVRRNKEDQNILEVKCAYCGNWFLPTKTSIEGRIGALNGSQSGEHRLYCSIQCKQECPIYNQTKWPKGFKPASSREVQPELRQMCFERDNYICQKCNKTQNELDVGLHCHHIEGIRWEPLESADLDMVITLCKECHINVHKLSGCGYYDLRCK